MAQEAPPFTALTLVASSDGLDGDVGITCLEAWGELFVMSRSSANRTQGPVYTLAHHRAKSFTISGTIHRWVILQDTKQLSANNSI